MSKTFNPPAAPEILYADPNQSPQRQIAERHVDARLEKIGFVLDQIFRIPGTEIRFGLDPIIGFLLPVAGDSISALISVYLVLRSIQYGLPKIVIGRMVFNVAFDYLIGSIPLVGDFLDFAFQANKKNVALLNRFAEGSERTRFTDYLWLFMLLGLFGAVVVVWLLMILWLLSSLFPVNLSMAGNRPTS
ncbi:MAG: DUF4112 domain-containing protein [Acidobacteria bacterium]|nr:DUF4112 domain-containing protein [Acidobacteriota bacterium]